MEPTPGIKYYFLSFYYLFINLILLFLGNEKLAIDVKKAGTKFILTVTGSSNVENVTVSFSGDVFHFTGESTALPVRLPFILARELVEMVAEPNKFVDFFCFFFFSFF